jgi:hypothetical protein
MASIFNLFEISADLRDALSSHNLTLEVTAEGDSTVRITLEYLPTTQVDQSVIVALIRRRIRFYTLEGIQWIEIVGILSGQKIPDWQVRFEPSPQTQVYYRDPFDLTDAFDELAKANLEENNVSEETESNFESLFENLNRITSNYDPVPTDLLTNQNNEQEKVNTSSDEIYQEHSSIDLFEKDYIPENQPKSLKGSRNRDALPETNQPGLISKVFRLDQGEGRLLLLLGFVLFLSSIAQKISEISSVSNFINVVEPDRILFVWGLDGLIVIAITSLQFFLVDRFERNNLVKGVSLILAIGSLTISLMESFGSPGWLRYSLLYLLSQQQALFFPLVVWLLANDNLNIAQSKRLFPKIATWELCGTLFGIGVAAAAPNLLASLGISLEVLLICNTAIYIIIVFVMQLNPIKKHTRKNHAHTVNAASVFVDAWSFLKEVSVFRYLVISILSIWICDVVLEFNFLLSSSDTFESLSDFQLFYSIITMLRLLGYIMIQVFIAEKLINNIGLKNTFVIAPISALLGSVSAAVIPEVWGATIGMLTEKLPWYSIDENARKSFQGLVPEDKRGRISVFMDNYLSGVGTVLGASLIGAAVFISSALFTVDSETLQPYYFTLSIVFSSFSVFAILRMRLVYDGSLLNWRLKRRQRGKSVFDKLDY